MQQAGTADGDEDFPVDWTEAVEALIVKWAEWYYVWRYESGIRWRRKDGFGGVQYAPVPDQADRDMGADYALRPAWLLPRTAAS